MRDSHRPVSGAGIAALALLLAACGATEPTTTPSGPASEPLAEPTQASAGPSGSGPGPSDELVLRLVQVGDVAWIYPVAALTVMADGQVISPPAENDMRWTVRQLSPAGVDELIGLAEGTGLFTASAEYPMLPRPDASPPAMGGCQTSVTFGSGADQVVVSGTCWFGDEYEATHNLPSPQRRALSALAERLRDLDWLPEDAWVRPDPAAYEADEYLLITSWYQGSNPGFPDVAEVAWPFDEALVDFGTQLRGGSQMLRCGTVGQAQAADIASQLAGLLDRDPSLAGDWYAPLNRTPDAAVDLWLMPQLPDGFPGCGELLIGG